MGPYNSSLDVPASQDGHLKEEQNGKRNRAFPPIHLDNPNGQEIDHVVRIMGKTPPPPEREAWKQGRDSTKR